MDFMEKVYEREAQIVDQTMCSSEGVSQSSGRVNSLSSNQVAHNTLAQQLLLCSKDLDTGESGRSQSLRKLSPTVSNGYLLDEDAGLTPNLLE